MTCLSDTRIAVIGLGYVGLPLAVEFSKKYSVYGFDIDPVRIDELQNGRDRTREVESSVLTSSEIKFSSDISGIKAANVYIITAPTPIDEHKQPDLTPVLSAARSVAQVLEIGDTVIFESTVYPGATEDDCVPVLEKESGLAFNIDFFVGYSPERINPGDKKHRVHNIVKVTSGSTEQTADFVDELYGSIIEAGTHRAPSIKVAEAAKVIENTQRDVNIALINELAVLFNTLEINTDDVLKAAGSKWNFLPFRPGLVGGHCIGVDPYYLTHKAQAVGYHPEIILAGRRLNDSMGSYVASALVKKMAKRGMRVLGSRALILGLTFKENTPDLRNTRVIDIVNELVEYGVDVDVFDPWADKTVAKDLYSIDLLEKPEINYYQSVILAVAHDEFLDFKRRNIRSLLQDQEQGIIYDLKAMMPKDTVDISL